MSFGYSVGDAILLTQLAWRTVQNARKACGEHNELMREVLGLHVVIRRLEQETRAATSINRSRDIYKEELDILVGGCKKNLNVLDQVLTKYNALGEQESGRKLWQRIKFGNGKMVEMADLRARLTYYTSAISLCLNIVSTGTIGRVEQQLNNAGEDLREIKIAVNEITAELISKSKGQEGSILTAYANDDRAVWKEFRRELVRDGFSSSVIRKHKKLIKNYIEELGSRGFLDEVEPNDDAECNDDSVVPSNFVLSPETPSGSEGSRAALESSLKATASLGLDTMPEAARNLQTELGDRKGPIHDHVSEVGRGTNPKAELRWIPLSNKFDRNNQQRTIKEIKTPECERGSSFSTESTKIQRSNDRERRPRDEPVSSTENDGSTPGVGVSDDRSEQGRGKQITEDAREINATKPLNNVDKVTAFHLRIKRQDLLARRKEDLFEREREVRRKEEACRAHLQRLREDNALDQLLQQENPWRRFIEELREENALDRELLQKEDSFRDYLEESKGENPFDPELVRKEEAFCDYLRLLRMATCNGKRLLVTILEELGMFEFMTVSKDSGTEFLRNILGHLVDNYLFVDNSR